MSSLRTARILAWLYPPMWRERYGEELEALLAEMSGGGRLPWRARVDVARAGGRERLRAAGLDPCGAPSDQARGGILLVLVSWAVFVVAGTLVQKFSEHWQDVTPSHSQALPSGAYAGLVAVAVCGTVLVLAGIGWTIPALVAFLRDGGWATIRRPVITAALLTSLAMVATFALVVWAHGLTGRQRAGHDTAYAIAFGAWALLGTACLFAWTVAAVAIGGRLSLRDATLRLETRIAVAVAASMGAMTAATAVWWLAISDSAPWFLAGRAVGEGGSPLAPQMVAASALMVFASLLGVAGSRGALRALPALRSHGLG